MMYVLVHMYIHIYSTTHVGSGCWVNNNKKNFVTCVIIPYEQEKQVTKPCLLFKKKGSYRGRCSNRRNGSLEWGDGMGWDMIAERTWDVLYKTYI